MNLFKYLIDNETKIGTFSKDGLHLAKDLVLFSGIATIFLKLELLITFSIKGR